MTSKDISKVKLPAFIYDSPQTWWLMCESIFSTYKIKNRNKKYNRLVTNLLADVTSKLFYIYAHPIKESVNVDPRLGMLRAALFQRYSPTNYECFRSFTTMKPLQTGQKLSVLCDSLRACLPAHICVDDHDYFFIIMFLSAAPVNQATVPGCKNHQDQQACGLRVPRQHAHGHSTCGR